MLVVQGCIVPSAKSLFQSTSLPAAGASPAVVELARAGKTIAAIQEYRSATGAGLAEAKAVVESLR